VDSSTTTGALGPAVSRRDAGDPGEVDVQQDQIGRRLPDQLERLLAGLGRAHDDEAVDLTDHGGDCGAKGFVVVDHEDPNGFQHITSF
jgi:hypothetical protein